MKRAISKVLICALVILGGSAVAGGIRLADAATSSAAASVFCRDTSADYTALKNALAASNVVTAAGRCDLNSSTLDIPAGDALRGVAGSDSGIGTEIMGNVTMSSGESATIEDLQIYCNSLGDGILASGWQETIDHVTVTDCAYGIVLDNKTGGTGNHVNDRITDNFIQGTASYGFYVNDGGNGVTDGYFDNNIVANGTVGIYMTNAAGWRIDANHIYSQSGDAIKVTRMWGSQISGNYIENYAGTGISGTVQDGEIGSAVSDNRVFTNDGAAAGGTGPAAVGIALSTSGSPAFVTVTGNVLVGNVAGSTGSAGESFAGAITVASTGNMIRDMGTAVATAGGATVSAGN